MTGEINPNPLLTCVNELGRADLTLTRLSDGVHSELVVLTAVSFGEEAVGLCGKAEPRLVGAVCELGHVVLSVAGGIPAEDDGVGLTLPVYTTPHRSTGHLTEG